VINLNVKSAQQQNQPIQRLYDYPTSNQRKTLFFIKNPWILVHQIHDIELQNRTTL